MARSDAFRTDSFCFSTNQADLLVDGPDALHAMLDAIRQARSHIHIEIYIYKSVGEGETGQHFARALLEKVEQGVEVCLVYDPAGSRAAPQSFFKHLAGHGVQVLEYNPVNPFRVRGAWRPNMRDHRKMLICDGRVGIIGGVDISQHYSQQSYALLDQGRISPRQGGWHDVDIRIEGPAVAVLQRLFLETWQRQKGPPLARNYFPLLEERGDRQVGIAISHPGNTPNAVHRAYLQAIEQASISVHIANAYFIPDKEIAAALRQAALRGTEVTLLLPGVSDFSAVVHGQRYYYDALLEAGVRIFEMHDRLLHAKFAVIDEQWCTVGSYNLDVRSFIHAEEVNAVILDKEFGAQLDALFRHDVMGSKQVQLGEWRKRSLLQRGLQWLFHRFRYWL